MDERETQKLRGMSVLPLAWRHHGVALFETYYFARQMKIPGFSDFKKGITSLFYSSPESDQSHDNTRLRSRSRSQQMNTTKRIRTPKTHMSPPPKRKKLDASANETPKSSPTTEKRRPGRPKGWTRKSSLLTPTAKSPIKTRRILKSNSTNPHCTLCKKIRKEELKHCYQCGLSYHLSHCLSMKEVQIRLLMDLEKWLCPKCIRCSSCHGVIDDNQNVECSQCFRAWHGLCFKGKNEEKSTICRRCKSGGVPLSPTTQDSLPSTSIETPKKTWRRGRKPAIVVAGQKKMPKGWVRIPEFVMHGGESSSTSVTSQEEESIEEILSSRARVWDSLVEEYSKVKSAHSSPVKKERGKSRSPEKKIPVLSPLSAQKISTVEDYDLFQSALRQLREEGQSLHDPPSTSTGHATAVGKWVYLGEAAKMKTLYATPYPADVLKGDCIYVCPFCLHPTAHADVYRIHMDKCEFRHPPGNEIYREDTLSFFEVDGAAQRQYCRNLCLLAKMFISSKTLHHEVETFFFYILTENTTKGCRIVAYFSKEKNPSKNNNLSCLLTLPGENRKGYGKLLIDMSYELSRLEHKIGSPEHPLSDLGLFAYRGYWRASILQHLRSLHNSQNTSIKSIALATRINPSDIINQLLRDKLLAYIDGNYFIKTGKRAYKWPLSFFRRPAIDRAKLIWRPGYDVSELDPHKLNYYV